MDAQTKAATLARLAAENPSALSETGLASVKGWGALGVPIANHAGAADAPRGFSDGPGWLRHSSGMLVHGPGSAAMLRGDSSGGMLNSAVFSIMRSKAEAYIEPPLRVWEGPWGDISNSEIVPHVADEMLQRQVSPWQTTARFKYAKRMALDAWGDYYALFVRGGGGTIQTNTTGPLLYLWGVSGRELKPARRKGAAEPITHYLLDIGKRDPLEIPIENVQGWHSGVDPDNALLGLGALRILAREVLTDNEADELVYFVMKNSGVPGMVLSPNGDQPFNTAAIESFKESIRARTSGNNRGDVFISPQGVDVHQYSFDPKGLNLSPVWKHIESRAGAVLGWPVSLAGLQAGMELKYANAGEAREHATETTLMSAWNMDGQGWDNLVRRTYGLKPGQYVAYDWTQVRALQDDMQAAHKREMDQVDRGLLVRDEWRVAHGWGDLPDDDAGLLVGDRASIVELIRAVGRGEVTRDAGLAMLVDGYRLTPQTAARIIPDGMTTLGATALGSRQTGQGATSSDFGKGAAISIGSATKAADTPVPVADSEIDDAVTEWDAWAAENAPDYAGILD